MSPIDYALAPLRKYADFNGRARRSEYWWYVLGLVVAYLVATVLDSLLGLNRMIAGLYGPFALLVALGTFVPSLAVAVRRLHDTNRSGWWMLVVVLPYLALGIVIGMAAGEGDAAAALGSAGLVALIAFAGAVLIFIFMLLDGTKGDNRFGPDPKAAERGALAG